MAGINLEKCPQEIMYTANSESMVTYHAKVIIRFGAETFQLPCIFTDRDDTPFLLGRIGFIDKFDMLLSARERKLIFIKIKK